MKALLPIVLALVIVSCAIWPPGEDPAGRKLLAEADKVLFALQRYVKAKGENPGSLQELVPAYLPSLPQEPEITYNAARGSLYFDYSPSWPTLGHCTCTATIESEGFGCGGYV